MLTNAQPIERGCNIIELPIVEEIKETTKKKKTRRRNLYARVTDGKAQTHSADSIRSRELINDFVLDLLIKGDIYKANLFVFNSNTGFRTGDTLSFRVKDLTNADGSIKDYVTLEEDKTDNYRTIWINDTVKKMLSYVIKSKGLTSNNYIFRGDGNRRTYVESLVVEDGELVNCKTTGVKYDDWGEERERAPLTVDHVGKWLKKICMNVGVEGKYSSHTFRQTYAYFISQGWNDNRYAQAACADFGHSSLRVTLAHYMGVNPQELREHQLALNLGKEAVDLWICQEHP